MSSGFFRGTNTEQDSRWGDAEKKLLRRTKFSKVLEQKVNMKKVNMDVMQRWITQRITSLLGFEDDIVVGTCVNYLSEEGKLDPKKLQLQLTGFLEKSTGTFMEELWGLLVDAQNSLGGIPSAFLQDKKQEMLQAKEEERRREEELGRRMAEHEQEMERSALLSDSNVAADETSSSSGVGAPARRKVTEGKRASRWGNPEVVGSATAATDVPILPATDVGVGTGTAPEGSGATTSEMDLNAREVATQRREDGAEPLIKRDEVVDRSPSAEAPRASSTSRRDGRDLDGGKERKRKSKNKHGKKADRKKSKSRHKGAEKQERRRHRKSPGEELSHRSGDEGSSSDDASDDTEAKAGMDAEEALRRKALASVASKKGQHAEKEN